jgi:hypothetical protein
MDENMFFSRKYAFLTGKGWDHSGSYPSFGKISDPGKNKSGYGPEN